MNCKLFCVLAAPLLATPLSAAPTAATLSGTVLNSCILTVSVGGALVSDSVGTTMRSDVGTGARSAILAVAALGQSPTLTFSSPLLSGPSGFTADTVQYAYSITGTGNSRGFSTATATATAKLIDTVTIDGMITSSSGFPTGTYSEAIQVTCGQS